jgi:hypothetical protein
LNVDLPSYTRSRRGVAESLRRQADILLRRAEQIEEEVAELECSLVEVDEASESATESVK